MFGTAQRGVKAYANVEMETGVFAASPHRLILMLFDGAKQALNNALMHMRNKQYADKGKSIAHAIRIISDGLQASLNKDVGGELARNLDNLYTYMINRLLQANLENSETKITEVLGLIETIRSAWVQIGENPKQDLSAMVSAQNESSAGTAATLAKG